MKDKAIAINPDLENQLATIDEEKLPQIFTEQVHFLEKANQQYCKAEKKEKQARKKVEIALKEADDLIEAAKNVGGHIAKKKKFLWAEWTSKRDEIDTLKTNLKEIIEHSENSAAAQKKLAEVQSSLMESQTAILQVQKANMEYQRQIANATKFVFGLSAYNMGVSQSIFVNLQAILSGETPGKMGELAQQQLLLALDQIRNQESLITRIKENENLIESLNSDIEAKQKEIDEISEVDEEQNRRIYENAQDIDALEQQDAEQDILIAEGIEKDKEHDEKISENAQDIDELEKQDKEQDKLIAKISKKVDEQDKELNKHSERDDELEKKIKALSQTNDEMIAILKKNISENADIANKHISLLESKVEKHIEDISDSIKKANEAFEEKIVDLSTELQNAIAELKDGTNLKVGNLEDRIDSLDKAFSKKVWKIAVSVVAGTSLILNALQILGIL